MASIASIHGVMRATRLLDPGEQPRFNPFSFSALRGRLVEIVVNSGTPAFSLIAILLKSAQRLSEPVVWISAGGSIFYPPDFSENGISIEHLPVVWTNGREPALRATEHLLRSGAFGLLVVDLEKPGEIKPGRLGTLNRLASLQQIVVVFLNTYSDGQREGLGSLISLRLSVELAHSGPNQFVCRVCAVKDKHAPAGWVQEVMFRGTDGLY